MRKQLLRLASMLNNMNLKKESSAVEYYVYKCSQQDDFSEFASDIISSEEEARGNISIPMSGDKLQINIFSHPLGSMIRSYTEKVAKAFARDLSKRNVSILVKEIDAVVDEFKKYNNDLSISPVHWSKNPKLIYPQTVRQVVRSIASFVYHNSPFEIEPEGFIEMIEHIHESYIDFYTEDYLGATGFDELEYAKKVDVWREENPEAIHPSAEAMYAKEKRREKAEIKRQMDEYIQQQEKSLDRGEINQDETKIL